MTQDMIKSSFDAGILHISLNRPEQLNALSQEVLEGLSQLFQNAKTDSTVKAILLTGECKGFCAGADIKQLAFLHSKQGLAFARVVQHIFRDLELIGKPSL